MTFSCNGWESWWCNCIYSQRAFSQLQFLKENSAVESHSILCIHRPSNVSIGYRENHCWAVNWLHQPLKWYDKLAGRWDAQGFQKQLAITLFMWFVGTFRVFRGGNNKLWFSINSPSNKRRPNCNELIDGINCGNGIYTKINNDFINWSVPNRTNWPEINHLTSATVSFSHI